MPRPDPVDAIPRVKLVLLGDSVRPSRLLPHCMGDMDSRLVSVLLLVHGRHSSGWGYVL